MNIKLIFSFNEKTIPDENYLDAYAYFLEDKNIIGLNLFLHKGTEEHIISDIIDALYHEYLHYVIWNCRKNLDKADSCLVQFFEEKLVASITGNEFDEEDYEYLIQGDEE